MDESENWLDNVVSVNVDGGNCRTVLNCAAPQSGFITKGGANSQYDQVMEFNGPVRLRGISGKAMVRIPWLGYVRLVLGAPDISGG